MKERDSLLAAIYCRLSEEDRDKCGGESESIQNQKAMLQQYAAEQGWRIFHIYCDEDYTGADRSRPAFNQLLNDAREKKFDIVLCKSQSRFTRELELVERYLHDLFPRWGIRFVGYADHADTFNRGNKKARQINGLVNEWYLEDLSDNIRTVFRSKQQQGLFIGSFAPYGYEKSADNKNILVPDKKAAEIVCRIFEMAAAGETAATISKKLNLDQVPNPSTHKMKKYPSFRRAGTVRTTWSAVSVREIVSNPVYRGDIRQHVREKVSYKSDIVKRVPPAEQILVCGTHQPLVSRELWLCAQQVMESGRERKPTGQGRDPLQARVRCSVCGQMLQIRYSHNKKYFVCKADRVLVQEVQVKNFASQGKLTENSTFEMKSKPRTELLQQLQTACIRMNEGKMSDAEFAVFCKKWQQEWESPDLNAHKGDMPDMLITVFPRQAKEKVPYMEFKYT